ncbi:MAG: hypothetical protein CRN43_22000, partial [Candidatus Nephrothrix sp. EaCA]
NPSEEGLLPGFSVYPIPSNDFITITDDNEMYSLSVGDFSGGLVLSEEVQGKEVMLSLADLA